MYTKFNFNFLNMVALQLVKQKSMKTRWGWAACCEESQTNESGAGKRESDLSAGFLRWRRDSSPKKSHLTISGQARCSSRELVEIQEGETSQVEVGHAVSLSRRQWQQGEGSDGVSHCSCSGLLPSFRCYLSICFHRTSVIATALLACLITAMRTWPEVKAQGGLNTLICYRIQNFDY